MAHSTIRYRQAHPSVLSLVFAMLGMLCGPLDAVAQDSAIKAPHSTINMQTGLWSVTATTTVTGFDSKSLDKDLAKYPDRRRKYFATIIGKTSVQKSNYCQKSDDLVKGNPLGILNGCQNPQMSMTSDQVTLHCGGRNQPSEALYRIQRVGAARVEGTARLNAHGDPEMQLDRKIGATFVGANCASAIQDMQQKAFIANGADPDMLSFLPPRPGQDEVKFHGLFAYGWSSRSQNCQAHVRTITGEHCTLVPFIDLPGGLPGLAYGYVEVKVNGTDGHALYLTAFPNSHTSFTAPKRFRVDRAGRVSEIAGFPRSMHGGFGPNEMGAQ